MQHVQYQQGQLQGHQHQQPRDQRAMSPAPPPPSSFPLPSGSFPTGEVDQDVFDAMGASRLSVRFEINIVKVSWFTLFWLFRT